MCDKLLIRIIYYANNKQMDTNNFRRQWFKFYGQDWLTDIKIMQLGPEDRLCYITLLCLASASDEQGVIRGITEESLIKMTHLYNDPYSDDNEATRAKGCLDRFRAHNMITIDNIGSVSSVSIVNFAKGSVDYCGYSLQSW